MANTTPTHVVAFDIGGTKLLGALVDQNGKTSYREKHPVLIAGGIAAFVGQIVQVVRSLEDQAGQEVRQVGLACAGPLDPTTGVLLDPTNFFSDGKSWGRVELVRELTQRLPQKRFTLENDAAAAALAEGWLGHGREVQNLVVMTLGTGVGVGVIANGALVRSGRHLHPEASHIALNLADESAPCGCGLNGCIEAYLSGVNFTKRMAKRWQDETLTGESLVARARSGDARALQAFQEYGDALAYAVHSMAVLFAPERVVLSGGFAAASALFLPTAEEKLAQLMVRRRVGVDLLPQICVSQQGEDLGLLGAARVAFLRH